MKKIILFTIWALLMPIVLRAQPPRGYTNYYGVYTSSFLTDTHLNCWKQPDSTVWVDFGYPYHFDSSFHYSETLTLPETVTSPQGKIYPVSGVAYNGLGYSKVFEQVKTLILPECYKTIDGFAGGGIASPFPVLEEVDAPGVERIGDNVFSAAKSLKTVNMPKVKELQGSVFYGCRSLTDIDLPELDACYLGLQFYSCTALKNVHLPKLKNMGQEMFTNCDSLKYLELPSVITLDNMALDGFASNLEVLKLPKIKVINRGYNSSKNHLREVYMPELEVLEPSAFFTGATPLTKVYMPKLREIGSYAFTNCPSLEHIELPSVETVRPYYGTSKCLFNGCTKLRYVSLPKLKENVDPTMIQHCGKIDTLLVPSTPKAIINSTMGTFTMLDISSVKSEDMYDSRSYNYTNELEGLSGIKHLICNDIKCAYNIARAQDKGLMAQADYIFNAHGADYAGFDSLEVVNQTKPLADSVFLHMPNIKHIVLHKASEFKNVKELAKLQGLETIDVAKDETGDCSSTNGVLYDKAGTTLLYYPLANESDARPFNVPSGLKGIGEYALYHYPKVHELSFDYSLESIGAHAFDGSHIDRVTFDPVTPLKTVGDYAFANMTEDYFKYLKFPTSLETIGEGAFSGDTQLQAIELYDSKLTTVPKSAFAGLTSITSIALPNTVETIGENAFDGNAAMEYFTVPTSCTSIGANAFSGTALKVLNIPNVNASLTSSLAAAFPSTKPVSVFVPEGQTDGLSSFATQTSRTSTINGGKFYSFTRSYPLDLSDVASKAKAFIVSNYNVDAMSGKGVLYTESLNRSQLSAVPANTPIILLANSSTPVSFTYKILGTEPESIGMSIVNGAPGAIRIDNKVSIDGNDYNSYVLQWAESGDNASGVFVPVTAKEWYEVSTRKGEQSYLQLPSTGAGGSVASAKYFTLSVDATPTGISTIPQNGASNNDVWYNLQGQRVSTPAHGIYIHNGKKVVKQ